MNFLFVDQLLAYEPGKGATGVKHVTAMDTYLMPTHGGRPALLSCIVGEAIGQLCSWYVIKALDAKYRSVGGIVSKVNMYGQAYVGDSILLEIFVDHLDEQAVNWHGHASVRGKTILEVESSVGPCLPMAEFNDPEEVKMQLRMIDRPAEFVAQREGQAFIPSNIQYYPELTSYDRIISWEKGKEVIAEKNITLIAPYFIDHFPRKPVLPISLFLETQLQLGQLFLTDLMGFETMNHFHPRIVRNIKMKDFVQPGQVLTTRLTLKERSDERIVLAFHSEINGRKICFAEAEYTH